MMIKKFRCIYFEYGDDIPNDLAYFHTGYAPLVARLAQEIVKTNSWAKFNDEI